MSTPSPWSANALFLGPLIAERLQAQLGDDVRELLVIDELQGEAQPKQFPAVVIMVRDIRPSGQAQRSSTNVEMDWLVIVAVETIRRRDPGGRSAAAGPLIPKVVAALHGWTPPGVLRALAWRPGPRPDYGRDVSYFPLLFNHQVMAT